jgi:hypothetical protein
MTTEAAPGWRRDENGDLYRFLTPSERDQVAGARSGNRTSKPKPPRSSSRVSSSRVRRTTSTVTGLDR